MGGILLGTWKAPLRLDIILDVKDRHSLRWASIFSCLTMLLHACKHGNIFSLRLFDVRITSTDLGQWLTHYLIMYIRCPALSFMPCAYTTLVWVPMFVKHRDREPRQGLITLPTSSPRKGFCSVSPGPRTIRQWTPCFSFF